MSKTIKFTKMHGLGNDFMLIETMTQNLHLTPERIKAWANRKTGIGFDQLLLLSPLKAHPAAFNYRIFNADGNEVEQCGNGARCVGRFLYDNNFVKDTTFKINCLAGDLELRVSDDNQVTVNMGPPKFLLEEIPLLTNGDIKNSPHLHSIEKNIGTLSFSGVDNTFVAISMGNPHCVLPVSDIGLAPVQTLGAHLNQHPQFPEGVNVGFMQIIDKQSIKLRVFERGAGETAACGSGACAAAVAGQLLDLLSPAVTVHLNNGDLFIEWHGNGKPVFMTGPAAYVFEGFAPY